MFLQTDYVSCLADVRPKKKRIVTNIFFSDHATITTVNKTPMALQISDNCGNSGLMMRQLEHVILYVESDHTIYTRNRIRLDAALISVWRSYRKSALCNYLTYRPKQTLQTY